jgi:hypothetical protein
VPSRAVATSNKDLRDAIGAPKTADRSDLKWRAQGCRYPVSHFCSCFSDASKKRGATAILPMRNQIESCKTAPNIPILKNHDETRRGNGNRRHKDP